MSGASFKGNLEVLNLSDIFQSLAMNRHSGTLVVTDGKREKKIFFAEGEISLLSSSRRLKLGELLIATGKITEEDLDLALKLQKQNRKKLGEILVEEGFCDEEDIARIVRCQIEEEIYDLFLWRKAEFEFIADHMPEDLKKNSPNIMRLTLNTNALIMEALRRLDEWELIKQAVPSTKEIFVIVDKGKLDSVELPERLRAEIHHIDGKNNVEGLAERALISEFELCKLLADLVQAGAVRALATEELVQKAEEAYALNEHVAASALYQRLSEVLPGEAKVLIPLADSLRRAGDDRQALIVYEQLARQLEPTRDVEKLRRCYESIIALDPTRQDLVRKLEALESRSRSKRKGMGVPVFAIVAIAVIGGLVAFHNQIRLVLSGQASAKAKEEQDEKQASELLKLAKKDEVDAHDARGDVAKYKAACKQWWQHGWQIASKFPKTSVAHDVRLPLLLATDPSGFSIEIKGFVQGTTKLEEPIVEAIYTPVAGEDRVIVQVKRKGVHTPNERDAIAAEKSYSVGEFHDEIIPIEDRHKSAFGAEANVEVEPAFTDGSGKRLIAASRAGHVHIWDEDKPAADWARLQIGDLGDVPTAPVVFGSRAVVGTADRGLVQIDIEGKKVLPDVFPADGPVTGRPLVSVGQKRIVFATWSGQVLAFTLDGGKPIWEKRTEAPIDQGGAIHGDGVVLFPSHDDLLYAFDLKDGHPLWTCWIGGHAIAPPCAHQDCVVVATATELVCIGVQDGKVRQKYADPKGKSIRALTADDQRAVIVTEEGHVRALDPRTGKALWADDFSRPLTPNAELRPHLAIGGDRVIATIDGPRIYGLEPKSGSLVWIGTVDSGAIASGFAVQGDAVAVGATTTDVHVFRRQ